MRVSIQLQGLEKASKKDPELKNAKYEALTAAGKAFLRYAGRVPYVSGQLRGSMQPLADELGSRLPEKIPPSINSYPPNPEQSFQKGRQYSRIRWTESSLSFESLIPYYYRWQDKWNNPDEIGIQQAEEVLFEYMSKSDIFDDFL